MSREIQLHFGPRSPKEEERLIRCVGRLAKPGDKWSVHCDSASAAQKPNISNEPLETRIGESIERSLESKNEQLGCQALPANDAELAKQRARDTHDALLRVRGGLEQAVYTVAAEIVVRGAWQQIVAIAQMM